MSEHIGFRCPDDILAAIKQQMEASGKGRTEVLVEALRSAFGLSETRAVDSQIDERIQQAIAPLKEQIEELKRAVSPVKFDEANPEETPIEALGLDPMYYHSLKLAVLDKISDLLRYDFEGLKKTTKLTPRGVLRIAEVLQERGFYLKGMEPEGEQAA